MVNEMHCVTVSEWKLVHKRLDDLENIVKELKSKSELFGNGNQDLNSNLETQDFVETERVEINTQRLISNSPESDVVITLPVPDPSSTVVQESLTLTCSEVNTSGLQSTPTSSGILDIASAIASTSVMVTTERVIHARTPSASSCSSCSPNGIGIDDQNAFEKSRRAVISLERCDETEVLAGKPLLLLGLRNEQNKKNISIANTVKRNSTANVPREPAALSSLGKKNGKSDGSVDAVGEKQKQKRYKCLICARRFARKFDLSRHGRVHTREKRFPCRICAKRFKHKGGLNVHLRLHTGERQYACQICSKTFNWNYELKRHMRVHTGEKPYQCKLCSKSFSHQNSLKLHINGHTGEKPHNCQLCPKSFRQRQHLNEHLRTHTREKPFVCHFCKTSFSSSSGLKYHLTLHTAVE